MKRTPITVEALDSTYNNLNCAGPRHRPQRSAFKSTALKLGMKEADFEAWAKGKEWPEGQTCLRR